MAWLPGWLLGWLLGVRVVARVVASEVVLMKTVDSRKLDALKDFIEGGGGEWEGKWRGMVVKEDQGELEPIYTL